MGEETTFNFILQASMVLHQGNCSDDEISMVYKYLISIDNDILNTYINTNTLLPYDNDLELFMDILDVVMYYYEVKEEYEKCHQLKVKRIKTINIINNN